LLKDLVNGILVVKFIDANHMLLLMRISEVLVVDIT